MTQRFSRDVLAKHLLAMVRENTALAEFRLFLTPVFVENSFPGPQADMELVTRLMHLFEDDSLTEVEHRENARILGQALKSPLSNDRVVELLPLLVGRRRLCLVTSRLIQGKLSRTSFLSHLAQARMPLWLKQWLQSARDGQLEELCDALAEYDVERISKTLPAYP